MKRGASVKCSLLSVLIVAICLQTAYSRSPNFVLIFTDDQGYGDLSCYGSTQVKTPTLDRLAQEGARLTDFYVAAAVCTPSRAALMTACYPKRVNLATGSDFGVLLAGDPKGLNPDEITIAEVLKTKGYATGIFGKWHLGDQPEFLPTRQGFDEYFGIPYSHDIHPFHPNQKHFQFPPLPLLDGEDVIEMDPDADLLTRRITDRAVKFIDNHHDEPFFLYVPHPIPHRPLHVSDDFAGKIPDEAKKKLTGEKDGIDYRTRDRLFPAAISEIDWSVDQIIQALKRHNLARDTLVLFTSDNGPAVGSAGPLRGRKGSTFEGGMREPTVAWWPGKIEPGKDIGELVTAMDLLPTFAKLAGAEIPNDRVIDGLDVSDVLLKGTKTPRDRFFYHRGNSLMAVRSGPWKYHGNLPVRGKPAAKKSALYHLPTDIGEQRDVSAKHPEIVERLRGYLSTFEVELGLGNTLSANCRPAGSVKEPQPLQPHASSEL
jgi:arylsulfatase A